MKCKKLNIKLCHYCKELSPGAVRNSEEMCLVDRTAIRIQNVSDKIIKQYVLDWMHMSKYTDITWFIAAFKQVYPQHIEMLEKLLVLI